MAVQFIFGRSGSGKTARCINAVVDALLNTASDQTLILLVPEQATYQAERAILNDKRIAGYNRLHVLSFDRLQFMLLGKSTARQSLSGIGRRMIIHKILREQKTKLKILASSVDFQGTSRQLADVITELHQHVKSPQDIDSFLNNLDKDRHNLTALKFADISLVFKEYLNFIEDKFIDPDIQLNLACKKVSGSFVKGAKLWVDGFAGFTPAELAILAELLKTASDTQIALCLDPSDMNLINPNSEELNPVELFYPTQKTYVDILDIIKKCKIKLAQPLIFGKPFRFSNSTQLEHIERNIFKLNSPKQKVTDSIKIISAPNVRSEVKFVARQILELVKQKNLRFRDIAVIASDIDSYQHYIRAYFDDYRIPFFIDKRKPLAHHPAVSLICSALQAVINDFSSGNIFNYLKTDLADIDRSDVDLLENYCLAFGITSSDWLSDKNWNYQSKENQTFDEQQINHIRKKVCKPLIGLKEKLCFDVALNPKEFTQVIFDFLADLKVAQTITSWVEMAEKNQDRETTDRHRQSYAKILDIFDELVEVFADSSLSCKDYLSILNSAFSQLTLAFIPPMLDQVLVGSIERSRHPDLKTVFLIGTTQKQFPTPISYNSLLTDTDRAAAKLVDFPLAAATEQKLVERQYLAYIAFTRPSQFLYISYPAADGKASPIARSQFIDNLQSLFENLNEEHISDYKTDINNVHSHGELAESLCHHLGKDTCTASEHDNSLSENLLDNLCKDDTFSSLGFQIRSAINYDNIAQLDSGITAELFDKQITLSATRLGTFAACPYQYFARYILQLKEREEFKFEPLDLGTFYHAVLNALLKHLNSEKKSFATTDDATLLKILKEEISLLINTDSFISNFARHRPHNSFILQQAGDNLQYCVLAIAKMVRTGSFRPTKSECHFGFEEKGLGEYKINLPNKRQLLLNGKIDRIDTADINGEQQTIVFDYKRKTTTFDWSKFYHGLDMQLPIYMLAAANTSMSPYKNIIGAFYMPIEPDIENVTIDQLQKKIKSFDYKAKGIFNGQFYRQLDSHVTSGWSKFYNFSFAKEKEQYGNYNSSGVLTPDDFGKLLRFTEQKIIQLAQQIIAGKIDINPYKLGTKTPCQTCKYKSLCRFDWQINDYNYLESLGKQDVLKEAANING